MHDVLGNVIDVLEFFGPRAYQDDIFPMGIGQLIAPDTLRSNPRVGGLSRVFHLSQRSVISPERRLGSTTCVDLQCRDRPRVHAVSPAGDLYSADRHDRQADARDWAVRAARISARGIVGRCRETSSGVRTVCCHQW